MAEPPPPTSPRRPLHRRRIVVYPAVGLALTFILWTTGCMERMFYVPDAGPTPPPRRDIEAVRFTSADGTELSGWFIPAPGAEAAPTILHVHGNAGNVTSHYGFSSFLAERGFNLLIFDYRGYGESEGSARRRGPLIEDTHAALNYLLDRPDVDPERIGLFGHSLGGAIGLNVMAARAEVRAAVILEAFTGWREVAASSVGGSYPAPWWSRALASVVIPNGQRPIDAMTQIDRPILVVHGTADSIVDFEHGVALARAGGEAVEFVEVPGANHNGLQDAAPWLDDRIATFLHGHLGSRDVPPEQAD